MNHAEVRERVRLVIAETAPLRPIPVTRQSELRSDLGFDSLSLLELASVLEQEFGLPASTEDDSDVETVDELERLVLARLVATDGERTR